LGGIAQKQDQPSRRFRSDEGAEWRQAPLRLTLLAGHLVLAVVYTIQKVRRRASCNCRFARNVLVMVPTLPEPIVVAGNPN
jgi:hypothetical protein